MRNCKNIEINLFKGKYINNNRKMTNNNINSVGQI